MAAGAWRSDNTPGDLNRWQNLRASLAISQPISFEISENVEWAKDPKALNCLKCVFRDGMECVSLYVSFVAELFGLGG